MLHSCAVCKNNQFKIIPHSGTFKSIKQKGKIETDMLSCSHSFGTAVSCWQLQAPLPYQIPKVGPHFQAGNFKSIVAFL